MMMKETANDTSRSVFPTNNLFPHTHDDIMTVFLFPSSTPAQPNCRISSIELFSIKPFAFFRHSTSTLSQRSRLALCSFLRDNLKLFDL
jgi:hypothetical protein